MDAKAWMPWAPDAEQGVLGGLLLDNDNFDAVASQLDAPAFFDRSHRAVFEAIQSLVLASRPADVITVAEVLRDRGHLGELVEPAYLDQLAQDVPSGGKVRQYAAMVADKAARRRLIAVSDELKDLARIAETARGALETVQARLDHVLTKKSASEPRKIGDSLPARLDHWNALGAGDATPGIPTGLSALDEAMGGGLKPGRVVVVAARPSVGKTSLATQILMRVAQAGHPGLMLSQEMTTAELIDRCTAHLGRVDLGRISAGQFLEGDWGGITAAADALGGLPMFIDDQPAQSLQDIRSKARQVKRQHGLAVLVVDYLQLCAATGAADKRHHQIEQISRGIKALAKELGICVLLLSQLNRGSEGSEPELHHLKESGAIEEDADVVLLLHPIEKDGHTLRVLAKVAKNRGGRRGRLRLLFDGKLQHWSECDE